MIAILKKQLMFVHSSIFFDVHSSMFLKRCSYFINVHDLAKKLSNLLFMVSGDHDAGNPKMVGGNQPIKTYKISGIMDYIT